jgi:hypothetical protein
MFLCFNGLNLLGALEPALGAWLLNEGAFLVKTEDVLVC